MQNIILNMTSRRTNTPVYSQNNLSNQRLEAHASVDWITFIDPCSGWSCQVIIPEKCSGVQNQHLLMPTSNNGLLLNIYYVQAYTTDYHCVNHESKKEHWPVLTFFDKKILSLQIIFCHLNVVKWGRHKYCITWLGTKFQHRECSLCEKVHGNQDAVVLFISTKGVCFNWSSCHMKFPFSIDAE